MEKKRLPFGINAFREIREDGYYYVDKTAYIDMLMQEGAKNFFLSRPRRFGKSLLVNTLREAFEGNETFFSGLDLHGKWDWSTRSPVIHFDFSLGNFTSTESLDDIIDVQLRKFEGRAGLKAAARTPEGRLGELIDNLYSQTGQKVVLLVDEYDKPILDAIEDIKVATANRNTLRGLYGATKYSTDIMRFSFFTGVSRFAKTSLFSGVNNLFDITILKQYSSICGYTDADLDNVFSHEIDGLDRDEIREWYNGYSWLGEEKVYNPYDILYLLYHREYDCWWFKTGTPSFLVDTLKKKKVMSVNLSKMRPRSNLLESFDVNKLEPETLLFQSGYLTIAKKIARGGKVRYLLDYPNREVRENLNLLLLEILLPESSEKLLDECDDALHYLQTCDIDELRKLFQRALAGLPKQWHAPVDLTKYEAYFASAFYSYFMGMGLVARAEDATDKGRIDLVVEGPSFVYIFEFKMVSGKKRGIALKKILDMEYAQKYRGAAKTLYLAGVEISKKSHNIVGFEVIEDDGGDL